MIIVLKKGATESEEKDVIAKIESVGLSVHVSKGKERTIIGALGDEAKLVNIPLSVMPGVEKAMPVLKPYKLVSSELHEERTQVDIGGIKIGGKLIPVMAGPCSVEPGGPLVDTAKLIKEAGGSFLRGGAYKPRTSPYSFQGMGTEGLDVLQEGKKATGMPIVTEVMDPRDIEVMYDKVDMFQIGTRNMQNFRLLLEIGKQDKPVLLKRGLAATIKEFLMSAEYIASQGNSNIVLCERGIRTFETATRNTLDLSAVPVLQKESHLPVLVDPSHGTGYWHLVAPLAKAAVAVGADALMIEVHHDPANALSDGEQSLKPEKFAILMKELQLVAEAVGRTMK